MFLAATMYYMDTPARLDVRIIGKRVADRRVALRMEQTELADRASLSRAYVSRLESGIVKNPKVLDLESVAQALDIPMASLVAPDAVGHELRLTECADILSQLAGEPEEVIDAAMQMFRIAVAIRKGQRLARTN